MAVKGKSRLELKELLEDYPSLQQILQNIKQVIWIIDLTSNQILYVSPGFEVVWGRSCESLYSDSLSLLKSVHPEDRVKVISASPDDKQKSLSQTYRIIRPDGDLRWISTNMYIIYEEVKDSSLQVSISQDITFQKKVDQTLLKALDRSREQFTLSRRMSVARKPAVVLKTLMSLSELRIAKEAFISFTELQFGTTSSDFEIIASWPVDKNNTRKNPTVMLNESSLFEELGFLNLFHPSKPVIVTEISKDKRLTSVVQQLLLEAQIQTMVIFPMIASGNWLGCFLVFFTQEIHFEPVEMRQIKVLVDQASITLYNLHLLQIEAQSRHEAERANEIKTEFLAMISHELRTPLTSIIGFTNTLLADDVSWEPDEQRDFFQTIQQESSRLQELINHLLDLSRLEAGMLPIVLEPHSFQEIIDDILPEIKNITKNHSFALRLPEDLPPIYVDAKRIAQVLENLIHNAANYTPEGTRITLMAGKIGRYLQVSIVDQGPGIPAAERKRVFEAFRRGNNEESDVSKGAGLGLAICKGLVEAHGGRIWISRKISPGATISFTVPLVPLNQPEIFYGKE
jgi:PAS domain S-box-containing protein